MNLADSTLIFDPISTQISNPISIAELEAQITELAGNLNAANHRWLMLIAEFDRRDGWGDGATQSFAHWLNWKCGLDLGAAREKIRVAHALEKLPLISASMARGALSYSKVRALSRVATPETEDTLLMIALHGTASHVEKLVRQYRRAQDAAELTREALQFANRSVRYFYDDDGSLVLNARLPAESGAVLVKALEVATEDFWKADRSAKTAAGVSSGISSGVSSTVSSDVSCGISSGVSGDVSAETSATYKPSRAENIMQYRADTLALFAESFLKHGYEALSGGERQQIVIHIDAESLSHNGAGRCELEDGSALAAQTARRLSCDASVVKIIEDDAGLPLNVGRKTRSIAPAIRRALRSAGRCVRGTKVIGSRAARTRGFSTAITFDTGPMAARRSSRTLSRCAGSIIVRSTRAASPCSSWTTARYGSVTQAENASRFKQRPRVMCRRSSANINTSVWRSMRARPSLDGAADGWTTAWPWVD